MTSVAARSTGGGARDAPVLVLRALGLGDSLTAVPALRALRRLHPGRPLLLAAAGEPAALLRRLGIVDGVVEQRGLDGVPPGRSLGDHLAVNLHGRGPQSHRLLLAGWPSSLLAFGCPEVGPSPGPPAPAWQEDEHEVLRWCRLVEAAGAEADPTELRLPVRGLPPSPVDVLRDGSYVVIHPGAASGSRRWPAERWGRVAAALRATGRHVLVTGGPAERALAAEVVDCALRWSGGPGPGERPRPSGAAGPGAVMTGALGVERRGTTAVLPRTAPRARVASLAGELELPRTAALVASADLLLSGDTGVAHLGTAYGTPSVVLFGPVPPHLWRPLADQERHVVLWQGGDPGRRGDPHGDELDPALARIGVDEVLDAAARLLRL